MTEAPKKRNQRRAIRVMCWLGSVILAAACAVLLALWLLPVNRLLEQQAKTWLDDQDIPLEFTLSALTSQSLTAHNLRLQPHGDITADSIHAAYSLESLRQRRLHEITLQGLTLSVTQTENGAYQLRGLEKLLDAEAAANTEETATLPELPFNQLQAENVALSVQPQDGGAYTATASLLLRGDYSGTLSLHEAEIPLGDASVLLTNLVLNRETPDAPILFNLENIAHLTGGKAYFTPLKASGTFTPARDMQSATGNITVDDLREKWTLRLSGEADFKTGQWDMAFEQPAVTFETGILQPDMLFPILRGEVEQVTGSMALSGSLSKANSEADITSSGTLTLKNLGGVIADVPVSGISGAVALSSLWPPATKGQQRIDVSEILLGLPLSNGRMSFSLAQDGSVDFAPSTWRWANGDLRTNGARLNLYAPRLPDITLSAEGLALEELLSGLLKKGISATGKLDGNIPVSFSKDGDALITKGRLSTNGGGIIRYQPNDESPLQMGSSFQTDLLLSAMSNFHYELLTMDINSKDANELNVLLHVKGRNPELYDGQTIELNINLNGNLLDIVQSGMNVYTLPERLQEQLMQ